MHTVEKGLVTHRTVLAYDYTEECIMTSTKNNSPTSQLLLKILKTTRNIPHDSI
jgi:hypothetical protein